jgi:hypothetical protein
VTGGRVAFVARVRDARAPVRDFVAMGASVGEVTRWRPMNRHYNVVVPLEGRCKERVMSQNNFRFRAH